jgi:hypothetical protein
MPSGAVHPNRWPRTWYIPYMRLLLSGESGEAFGFW